MKIHETESIPNNISNIEVKIKNFEILDSDSDKGLHLTIRDSYNLLSQNIVAVVRCDNCDLKTKLIIPYNISYKNLELQWIKCKKCDAGIWMTYQKTH
jgi:hypothetical protein